MTKTVASTSDHQSTETSFLQCRKRTNQFCFSCARYVTLKQRTPFTESLQKRYKQTYNLKKIMNVDENFTPNIICKNCIRKFSGGKSRTSNFKTPALWNKPADDHKDCYLCNHNLTPQDIKRSINRKSKKNKNPYEYLSGLSVILPVTFKQAESGVINAQLNNSKGSEMDANDKMVSSDDEE